MHSRPQGDHQMSELTTIRRAPAPNHASTAIADRAASDVMPARAVPEVVREALRSPGQPLDTATRSLMEPRLGHDFSRVRVHADGQAAKSARALNALAYTVGRDVVFGAGQYAPRLKAGQSLLTHELTHVVQQGNAAWTGGDLTLGATDTPFEREAEAASWPGIAAAGEEPARPAARASVIQRTPASPSTGTGPAARDLNRIRVDAVPDFLASSLTAPRVVNVHVNESSVKHLAWELYDPSDNMMSGSFSTIPGTTNATTAPFTLEPSHFSGAGFVPGKYLLRCTGLDDRHQPVVYADRDFNVLRTDLTTGTALPTTYGELTFTRYNKTDANPPANPRYSIDVELRFLPASSVTCTDVAFIQSMQTVDNEGRSQQNTVNPQQDARKTPLAWSIDRIAGAPSPFYIVGRDPATRNPRDDPGWGRAGSGGKNPTPATLIDQPAWSRANNAKFESCVVCRSGANRGQVYGCATWGYTATAAGRVTLMPRSFRQMPSDQFEEARAAWNTWRTSVPAADRPEEAPALTGP
jgi:hypothetical protein